MKKVSTALMVLSVLIFIGGIAVSEGAPQQAAVAGMACFVAIIARMAQANAYHYSEMMENYRREQEAKTR